jgi:DNA-binding GntR family transcriptional regulator
LLVPAPIPPSAAQIADDLVDRIRSGEYPPGSRLPAYRELANLYDVGMTTISTVIVMLKARGFVVGAQGRGVFVVAPGKPGRG